MKMKRITRFHLFISYNMKNDRQRNDQKKKDKRTNNGLQNTTQNTKYLATGTPLKQGMNSGAPEG
jgi:hypothetical protein